MWLAVNHNTSITSDEWVRNVLHGQVSSAAVNQICVIHGAMNGCKKSKDSLKDCFENVNIRTITQVLKSFSYLVIKVIYLPFILARVTKMISI